MGGDALAEGCHARRHSHRDAWHVVKGSSAQSGYLRRRSSKLSVVARTSIDEDETEERQGPCLCCF